MSAAAIRKARDAWRKALDARDGALNNEAARKEDIVAAVRAEEEAFGVYIHLADAERDDEEGRR